MLLWWLFRFDGCLILLMWFVIVLACYADCWCFALFGRDVVYLMIVWFDCCFYCYVVWIGFVFGRLFAGLLDLACLWV